MAKRVVRSSCGSRTVLGQFLGSGWDQAHVVGENDLSRAYWIRKHEAESRSGAIAETDGKAAEFAVDALALSRKLKRHSVRLAVLLPVTPYGSSHRHLCSVRRSTSMSIGPWVVSSVANIPRQGCVTWHSPISIGKTVSWRPKDS